MIVFSIICLVVIMLSLQHLLNWVWRKTWEKDDTSLFIGVLWISGVSLAVSYACIYHILLWGKDLL